MRSTPSSTAGLVARSALPACEGFHELGHIPRTAPGSENLRYRCLIEPWPPRGPCPSPEAGYPPGRPDDNMLGAGCTLERDQASQSRGSMVKRRRQRLGLFSVSDRSDSRLSAPPDCRRGRYAIDWRSGNDAQGIRNRTEGNVLTLADVLPVDLERDRADGAEHELALVMQAEDVPGSGVPALPDTEHVAQGAEGGQRAQRARGEHVEAGVEAGLGTGVDGPAAQVGPWRGVGHDC